ncbi:hypothetical protein [Brevibacterium gallinarum]|uniref:hypothetical protein n=1 Tax=Brevibacterium gallinarum TaxID=2762220 RepID=UPI00178421B2|nr:hypothetical protein [Brevibacterium gallinarum]
MEQIAAAWRPLSEVEKNRADYYLGRASRLVRRTYPDVDERIADPGDRLTADDVADVVVALVMSIVPKPVAGARSWQQQAGPFSESVTLPASSADLPMTFEQWMRDVFAVDAHAKHGPAFAFPPAPAFDRLFGWEG